MKKSIAACLIALFSLVILAVPSFAQTIPPLPCAFWGSVSIDGQLAPIGTQVKATGTGILTGLAGNPITVTEVGKYGDESGLSPKLIARGDVAEGVKITFLVNEIVAKQTAIWQSGSVTKVDITVVTPSSGGGGGSDSSNDRTPPNIVSVNPLNNTVDLPNNTIITAKFSEAMSANSISINTFTLIQGITSVAGSVTYDSSNMTATFKPSADLAWSTTYKATITNGVKDVAGNALIANYLWSFTTTASPIITPMTTTPTITTSVTTPSKTPPPITTTPKTTTQITTLSEITSSGNIPAPTTDPSPDESSRSPLGLIAGIIAGAIIIILTVVIVINRRGKMP
jgi:hypothetical protein